MRYLRAAAALAALLGLLAGIPATLAATVGNPLHAWPDLLAGDLSDRVVIAVMAAVAYLAWAQFTLAVIVELAAAVTKVQVPTRLPMVFAGQRQLAHTLIAAAFLLTPLGPAMAPAHQAAAPATHVVAVQAAYTTPHPTIVTVVRGGETTAPDDAARQDQAPVAATGTITYVVQEQGPRTFWDLAERFLGDGTRWHKIWHLNQGRQQADGVTYSGPGLLRPGGTVLLPAEAAAHLQAPARPATHAQAPASPAVDQEPVSPLGEQQTGPQQVTVHRGDTLSGIAADHDVADWHQLWEANRGRSQPGGRHFANPDWILPGWTITVPGHPAAATDAPAPAPARQTPAAHQEPPPQQVAPTQQATVDAPDAAAAPTTSPATSPTEHAPDAGAPAVADPAPASTSPVPSAPLPREHPVGEESASSPVAPVEAATPVTSAPAVPAVAAQPTAPATSVAPEASETAAPTVEAVEPVTHEDGPAGMSLLAIGVFGAGGLLLAGAAGEALRRHRRRQLRYRRPGRAITATPLQLSRTERALLSGAGSPDVRWLAQALRGLVHLLAADPDGRLPDVVAARLTATDLQLVLAGPRPGPMPMPMPGAWTVMGPSAGRWRLQRDAPTGFDPALADRHLAPYPALVSVGYTADGDYWLVDLERVGALALTGDRDRCLDLARFIGAELAHNTWSEQLRVTVSGAGQELVGLNPDRVETVDDPAAAVAAAAAQLRSVAAGLDSAGVDVLTGRLRDVQADLWFPHVVLTTAPAQDFAAVLADMQARRGRSAVAVVLTGQAPLDQRPHGRQPQGPDTRWQLHVGADGRLRIPALGLDLIAQQLPAGEAEHLAQLLAVAARTQDRPMPDADGDATWQACCDLAGAPRPQLLEASRTGPVEAPKNRPVVESGPVPVCTDRVLPLPAATYLDAAATTDADLQTLAPPVSEQVRRRVHEADPELDADLAAWTDPDCVRPKLRVLGPLTVTTRTADLPAEGTRRAWTTEVVAYLACHPRGVSAEQLGADLWPGDPDITAKSKIRQAVYMVRKRLGVDPATGAEFVPAAVNPTGGPGLYRVQGLLVDADLFRRLRLRGVARGADGITDLQAALDLVTGPPFDDRRPGGYAWLADSPLDHTYTAMIVDVAHVVATHHLATGRPDLAAAAARVALSAGSTDDVALLDLVAACDAQGNRAEADRLVTRILANHDAEVEEDLPPRTAEVLHRRRWLERAS